MILSGKTAVVTGCLQGIGRATLDVFAQNGANVFACCQYETEEFTNHIKELSKETGVEIFEIYFDLMDDESIKQAAREIQKSKRTIDILVNIAGMTKDALFQMVTMDQLKTVFQVNYFSQILFSQYIIKLMLRNGSGSVINTSSISALDGNPGQLVYASSKAAVIAATKTMSAELAPKGIRVNAIAPGVIDTAMTAIIPQEDMNRLMSKSNIKKVGTPIEVANVILYLASDLSSFVTGQTIRVDGGIG
ncbi:MAG TPA: SDR family NAD(P)-dependent oxidoreductase [Anaerovoracaceae bacterium]|nr:SDR family NAD(P)-dependent oxidoreductase [Anaerovoracaceae bacterium]